jgi:hypothetical protein
MRLTSDHMFPGSESSVFRSSSLPTMGSLHEGQVKRLKR